MAIQKKTELGISAQEIANETILGANTANRVGDFGQNIIDSTIGNFVITSSELNTLRLASAIDISTLYTVSDAVSGTRTLELRAIANNSSVFAGRDLETNEQGIYALSIDSFTVIAGNYFIEFTYQSLLQSKETDGFLDIDTVYIVQDSTPFKLICKAVSDNELAKNADILDFVYSGNVFYNLETGVITNGTIYDGNGNIWHSPYNGSIITLLGDDCVRNTFHQLAASNQLGNICEDNIFYQNATNNSLGNSCKKNTFNQESQGNVLGDGCIQNTFGQGAVNFTFSDNLKNVTIEANVFGMDCSDPTDYAFLYNKSYVGTIFRDGSGTYHRYYDIDNDRIVITDLNTPTNITYIGGGSGGTQDLQSVTTEGATTTNSITFGPGAGINLDNSSYLKEGTFSFGDYNVVLSGIINAGDGFINPVTGWEDPTGPMPSGTKWSDLNGLYIKTAVAVTPSGYGAGDIGMHNPEPGTFNYYLAPVDNSAFNGVAYFLAPGNRSGWGLPNDNGTTDTPVNYWRLCVLADYPYIYFTNPSEDPYNFPTTGWVPVDAGATPPLNQGSEYLDNYDSGFDIQITTTGNKGISRFCTVGYEDNWQSGIKYVLDLNGLIREVTNCFKYIPNNLFDATQRFKVGSRWVLDDGTTYMCLDATAGSAVWVNKGNAFIVEITSTELAALETAMTLDLNTLYFITDAPEFPLMCKASAPNKLGKTATIFDRNYAGSVYYDVQDNTLECIAITDASQSPNQWFGVLPTYWSLGGCSRNVFFAESGGTLGVSCRFNTFEQSAANNILGDNCQANTFKQGAIDFTFGNGLQNVTIEPFVTGADYSDPTDYAFLYGRSYAATIFTDGTDNYHRYYDPANDRIVVTNLTTLDETYIGGSGGVYIKDANDNVFFSDAEQSTTTFVGVSPCTNNIFHQNAINNTLGELSRGNTFGQDSYGFTFGNKLRNVTIEANIIGADYSDETDYAFIYNKEYASTIFQSGGITYHRYYDVATDRIVVTLMASPFTVSYIGGVAGSGDMLKSTYDINNNGLVDKAQSMVTQGRNSTGATLYKGTIIYISGATGQLPNFVKARADIEATSAGTFGVVIADIANNSNGWVNTIGLLENIDTRTTATHPFTDDTLAVGDTIYLHPTIAGYVTNVKPSAPNHLVYIGKVVNVGPATQGAIVYRMQNGYELDELHDVQATSPTNKDVLVYNATTSLWETSSIATILGFTPKPPIVSVGNGTAVTGTGITLCKTLSIPANAREAGDAPELYVQTTKNLANGTQFVRVYWNTSASLTGAILLASTGAAVAGTLSQALIRHMGIEDTGGGGNGTQIVQPTAGINNPYVPTVQPIVPVAINWASAGFIIVSIQNGSSSDTSNCNLISLK